MTSAAQTSMWPPPTWRSVVRCHPIARRLADGHYSRQTPGAADFMGNGRTLVLLSADDLAVWGVIENMVPGGGERRWRVSIFRNTSPVLSSDLVREATVMTRDYWRSHYHGEPSVPLTTEVDPAKTRRKRDPGRCFRKAGWSYLGGSVKSATSKRGLVVLVAP